MIFVTVGTDQPFDRMLKVIDKWALESGRTDVFAQIGDGAWEPQHIPFVEFLEPSEFKRRFAEADLVIGHAGMGTILSALLHGKPILVVPKKASLGEHRNEHQTATARRMMALGNVDVAFDEAELRERLDHVDELRAKSPIADHASGSLVDGIRSFIFDGQGSER
ncbi:glycosyltransferase [Luteolibacter marinus]|uniref:glycosyltransferase n=1 Tax=Luteolibacter marinus TaxID=2776705 RepID=UPI0018689D80|nr:glycosyltransferase [Luteolibacter marinus]